MHNGHAKKKENDIAMMGIQSWQPLGLLLKVKLLVGYM